MMKHRLLPIISLILSLLFLTSCDSVFYIEPQEETTESLKRIFFAEPEISDTEKAQFTQITNLPTMYITLGEGDIKVSDITKGNYIPGTYTLIDGENNVYEKYLQIKGRGNYSWSFPKKPYTFKLAYENDLLGMGSGPKWVLIGSHSDKTLMRNYIALNLAKDAGMENVSDCRFIDVYMNGEYHGNYLLTESIQIHPNRVDIDKDTDALFEIEIGDRHGWYCEYCITVPSGVHIMFKEPDNGDIAHDEKLQRLAEYQEFFTAFDEALSVGYEEYSKYIDFDSFVNWYIINEFMKNYDSGFTTSCYCYIKDGKLYMGPAWDYDTCMGNQNAASCLNPRGYHVAGSPWFRRFTNDKDFMKRLTERWTELRDTGVFDTFMARIYETADYLSESEPLDHERWPKALKSTELRGDKSKFTFNEEVDYMANWLYTRLDFLDSEWYGK